MKTQCCYIGLGSNLGDPAAQLRLALSALDRVKGISLKRCSAFYRTRPWGRTGQPEFINAVAEISTRLDAGQLLDCLQEIEQQLGRQADKSHWGPRPIDLDLLLYGSEIIRTDRLIVPHPRMHQRMFVLVPLLELSANIEIPGCGPVDEFVEALKDQQPGSVIAVISGGAEEQE